MPDCIFCKIISGNIPGHIIDEDEQVMVFLSLEHHPLVVPKKHIPDLFSLDPKTASAIMAKAIAVAKAMRKGLPCDGIYVTQANGSSAGQDVFHYHMHLYPKWSHQQDTHLGQSKEDLANRIRAALNTKTE